MNVYSVISEKCAKEASEILYIKEYENTIYGDVIKRLEESMRAKIDAHNYDIGEETEAIAAINEIIDANKRALDILAPVAPIEEPKTCVDRIYTVATVTESRPEEIRFMTFDAFVFNGKQYNCNKFVEILRTLARVLYKENRRVIENMVDDNNGDVKFVSIPVTYNCGIVGDHRFDENVDIYLHDNLSANDCVKAAIDLIKRYGYEEKDLTLVNLRRKDLGNATFFN